MEKTFIITNAMGQTKEYQGYSSVEELRQQIIASGANPDNYKITEKPQETIDTLNASVVPADATSNVLQRSDNNETSALETAWNIVNPAVYMKKADEATTGENPLVRLPAMGAGAAIDAALTLFSPVRWMAKGVGKVISKNAPNTIKQGADAARRDFSSMFTTQKIPDNIINRSSNAIVGAAEGMLASGDVSAASGLPGALFGGAIGANVSKNVQNAERELVKFSRAPSYQQRQVKEYLNRKYKINAKESPAAIRELIKKEVKPGENIETVILKNEEELNKLNAQMDNLLNTSYAGNINIGTTFPDFTGAIKSEVYTAERGIGRSEGEKLEQAVAEIMNDIRFAQLEKKAEAGDITGAKMNLEAAREFVKNNEEGLLASIPLTLFDVDELKRAMQKRTSIYKRSSAAMARAGVETMANAAGAKAINKELDLLKNIPEELIAETIILQDRLGKAGFKSMIDAMGFAEEKLDDIEQKLFDKLVRKEIITNYRKINSERSDLILKNDVFETMLSKFEFAKPDESFRPTAHVNLANKQMYSVPLSETARATNRLAPMMMGNKTIPSDTTGTVPMMGSTP